MFTDQPLKRFSIIGSGNVATALAIALSHVGDVREVFSRDIRHARVLADAINDGYRSGYASGQQVACAPRNTTVRNSVVSSEPPAVCRAIDRLEELSVDSDFYLISVVDDAIPEIVAATSHITSGLWAHTSGSTPMSVLHTGRGDSGEGSCTRRWGVFYPLQTFSKGKSYDMSRVPLLIEGCDVETEKRLTCLAESLSKDVKAVDSSGRMRLHVAAVFACNFVNYMWTLADDLLHQSGMDVTVLTPLLEETLAKLNVLSPEAGQTGPARRGDHEIMEKHCGMLDGEKLEVYRMLSRLINERYNGSPIK